ncbi:E3 ubiquitin-protein ligase TRAIP-like [Culicoides brevitarsis]|uniref:E3 ubiquitin-protein ligase TRAIP-like n=1 Tax=Culicoides brevitarsis TaxID=469753 RepID=UPI00307C4AB6
MNINCIICSDLFISADSIVTAGSCGHCFHVHCLEQWLERSKTCPQCRSKCTQRNTIRIYLNILSNEDLAEDAGTLITKVDNLTLQVRQKDGKIGSLETEIEKRKKELSKSAKIVQTLEKNLKTTEALLNAHREEVKLLKLDNAHVHQLASENKELKQKVEIMKTVEDVLAATAAEVEDLIKKENDPRVLGVLVTSLKRELKHADSKKQMLRESMKLTQADHKREMEQRKKLEEKCAHLEAEVYRLEQELKNSLDSTTYISPVNQKSLKTSPIDVKSPSRFKFDDEPKPKSDSPYLNLKSSCVGLSPLLNNRKTERRDENESLASQFTIFKKPRLTVKNTTVRSDFAFDGLGGTSKKENTEFPVPVSSNVLTSASSHTLKRIPSAKFKKLTKTPTLGKIDNFLLKH